MSHPLVIALITTDLRDDHRKYSEPEPSFGTAPTALLQGLASYPDCVVHVISCVQSPVASPEKIAGNLFYHSIPVGKWGWMRGGYAGCILRIRKKLQEIKPDIVHGQGTERYCSLSAVFSGFPNVLTIHGNMAKIAHLFEAPVGSFHWLTGKIEDFTLPKTFGVLCNSAYTESLVRPRAKKVWRVPNAIRKDFFQPKIASPASALPMLLNVGVITQYKRQIELLRLAKKLHNDGALFLLKFIGSVDFSNSYARQFLSEIEIAKAQGYAEYIGSMEMGGLIKTMDEASALVHFPNEEAFGLVVAEGLARNLKFFGSKVGGIEEIAAGVAGAEIIDEDRWDQLGERITLWLKNGALKPLTVCTDMESRYHPSVIAKRHLEIYREVLASKKLFNQS